MQAGLPYFTLPELGPFKPFGILVAIGVLLGARLIYRRTERLGLNMEHARGLVIWSAVIGFVGAHVIDVLAYQMDDLRRDPLLLIKIWAGISSYGGFIGGTVGFFLYALGVRMKGFIKLFTFPRRGGVDFYLFYLPVKLAHRLPLAVWADSVVAGLMVGFTFGRLGCTIVHDHIGRATDFPLGVYYSEHVIREHPYYPIQPGVHHNLGLYEFVFCLVLVGILFLVDRKPVRPGTIVGVLATLYAPVRFLMEYLRLDVTDPRYFGLTFAQWTSVLTLTIGLFMLGRVLLRRPSLEAAVAADASAAKVHTAAEVLRVKARAAAAKARAAAAKAQAAEVKSGAAAKAKAAKIARAAEADAKAADADVRAAEAAALAAATRADAAAAKAFGLDTAGKDAEGKAGAGNVGKTGKGGARKSGKKR